MFLGEFVFLDLETTGATVDADRITEIGLISVKDGVYQDEWQTLINPQRKIPFNIQMITGIDDPMVENAPTFSDVYESLFARLDGKILVAHNVRFDYAFLRKEFKSNGIKYSPSLLCTVKLSRLLYPEERKHGLDSIIKRLSLACGTRHRAMTDTQAIWDFAQHVQKNFESSLISTSIEKLIKGSSLPKGIDKEMVDAIPSCPGVYIFKGENGCILYVGKSKNLRVRINSHFSGDHSNRKDLKINQNITQIDWHESAGELGALLLESQLVKTMSPLYNRKLRQQKDSFTIHWDPIDGPKNPHIADLSEFNKIPFGFIYGIFDSKKSALKTLRDLSKTYNLCLKTLGIEPGEGPCFSHQLGVCMGACIEKESALNHAMRLSLALNKFLIPTWPFNGEVLLIEHSERSGLVEKHRVKNWAYLDYQVTGKKSSSEYRLLPSKEFEYDTFQILRKLIEKPTNHITIIPQI
ncbi:MAG: exonuclease domain-containing protein [Proteobacteria bacterium]|nr:exonuclease domain-containing protein [Pseudomonadota bacterium]MDA1011323.1 exonuclease domain-containing protein [Pseudomonadota bacterium]